MPITLPQALDHHRSTADAFAELAEAIPADAWDKPWTEGKWTVGTIVDHLNHTYDVVIREVEGGEGMRIVTPWWQQLLLRWTLRPRLLAGKPFPKAARAPRETRPAEETPEREPALAGFRERADRLEASAREAGGSRPEARVSHAYFGKGSLAQGVTMCTRHIEHHHRQLETLRP
jgi:hypothetical protein